MNFQNGLLYCAFLSVLIASLQIFAIKIYECAFTSDIFAVIIALSDIVISAIIIIIINYIESKK